MIFLSPQTFNFKILITWKQMLSLCSGWVLVHPHQKSIASSTALLLYRPSMSSPVDPERPPDPAFDIPLALRFVFDDPGWLPKLLIGSLFTLLSIFLIGNIWIAGYGVRLVRRVVDGERHPLPDWNDLGGMFQDGLRATIILLIHTIPILIIMVILALAMGGAIAVFDTAQNVPRGFRLTLVLLAVAGYVLFTFVNLALLFYIPAVLARFVLLNRVSAAFEVRENVSFIRRNLKNYSRALSAALIAGFVAQFGVLVFCIGIFPATFWSICVLGFAIGEVARADENRQAKEAS
jgi:hypothetical protein